MLTNSSLKDEIQQRLEALDKRLRKLRATVRGLKVKAVNRVSVRQEAEDLADMWVEQIRPYLENDFAFPSDVIAKYAELFKKLYIISRPSNLASSYHDYLGKLTKNFKDDLILPIQQGAEPASKNATLRALVRRVPQGEISSYLSEAIKCAEAGSIRGAIVLAWCAAIDRVQRKISELGFQRFSQATTLMKQTTKGRFREFKKEYGITTLSELQEIPDSDLLSVIEYLGLIDSNEGDRLRMHLKYRTQAAHPGAAPLNETHLAPFISDLLDIVLLNPKLAVSAIAPPP